MGIKLSYRKPGPDKNLELLLKEALDSMSRKDWNLESESARKTIAKYLTNKVLNKAGKKKWWDKYFYTL